MILYGWIIPSGGITMGRVCDQCGYQSSSLIYSYYPITLSFSESIQHIYSIYSVWEQASYALDLFFYPSKPFTVKAISDMV